MASGSITSWQKSGETMETVTNCIFLGSKITADGDCSHEIIRYFLLGRKAITNLDTILKSRDITLPTKFHHSYVFSSMYLRVELNTEELMLLSCGVGEDLSPFVLWCWRRLLRVPGTTRRSNQSILKEISSEYPLEGLMLKLKLQYLGLQMIGTNSSEKNPDAGKDWRQDIQGTSEDEMVGWHHWLNGHKSKQVPGVGDVKESRDCCSPFDCQESIELNWSVVKKLYQK